MVLVTDAAVIDVTTRWIADQSGEDRDALTGGPDRIRTGDLVLDRDVC